MISKASVIENIRAAFKEVVLDGGIGLSEGEAMDNYASEQELSRCRVIDEKLHWDAIPAEALNKNYCSLSYFDAKGMRFHLPAFMIADINGEYRFEVNSLVYVSEHNKMQFELLSNDQRAAVKLYLEYCRENDDYMAEDITKAISEYWSFPAL